MNVMSSAMAAGAKTLDRLPKGAQARIWQGMQTSHLVLFRASGGRLGGELGDLKVLFLHHRGAKTGKKRISPLLYVTDGKNLAIIASKGGYAKHPAWFHNLKAFPDAEVELRGGRRPVRARVATGDERKKLWKKAAKVWPDYDRYQQRAGDRKIPVVVLEPR
jgi:deazaflavin-dependent oxidoreductase (nitroreductase family)